MPQSVDLDVIHLVPNHIRRFLREPRPHGWLAARMTEHDTHMHRFNEIDGLPAAAFALSIVERH